MQVIWSLKEATGPDVTFKAERLCLREFEVTVLNGSWLDAADCQLIPHTHCDLTFDLGSDSDYNLHVRAQCGPQLSAWSQLSPPFNRRDGKKTSSILMSGQTMFERTTFYPGGHFSSSDMISVIFVRSGHGGAEDDGDNLR